MPVTNAFLSSKLVSKLACRKKGRKEGMLKNVQTIGDDGGWRWQRVWVCTWYMIEEGGGSMHGCWSGRGSSSSRSTLDRASSRVTWVVMVTRRHSHNTPVWEEQRRRERGYEIWSITESQKMQKRTEFCTTGGYYETTRGYVERLCSRFNKIQSMIQFNKYILSQNSWTLCVPTECRLK